MSAYVGRSKNLKDLEDPSYTGRCPQTREQMLASGFGETSSRSAAQETQCTGVPRSYEIAPPSDPTVGLSIRPYAGPGGVGGFLMSEVPLS